MKTKILILLLLASSTAFAANECYIMVNEKTVDADDIKFMAQRNSEIRVHLKTGETLVAKKRSPIVAANYIEQIADLIHDECHKGESNELIPR